MLINLPAETILNIGEYLSIHDVYSLIRTAHRFHSLLISHLYELGVDYVFDDEKNPIIWPLQDGRISVVRDLIDKETNPVIWAVRNRQMSVLRNLLAKETYAIHAHRTDLTGGTTALHQAVNGENEDAIQVLLQHRTTISLRDKQGETPLTLAIKSNNENVVRILLDAGAGSTFTSWGEWHRAARQTAFQGHPSILRVLIDAAVRRGWTPEGEPVSRDVVSEAARGGRAGVLEMLCEVGWNIQEPTAFCKAVESGSLECVQLFLRCGMDIDSGDYAWRPPLLDAIRHKKLQIVQCLLDAGADVDVVDEEENGVLHSAAIAGDAEIVRCLLAAKADVQAVDSEDQTPLHLLMQAMTLEEHEEEVVKEILGILLEAGVDVHHKGDGGATVLHLAIGTTAGIVQMLLDAGADPNSRDEDGDSPLYGAAKGCDWEIAQCLIDGGADVNLAGWRGQTPLWWAVVNKSTATIGVLLDAGADASIPDKTGVLPIHEAAKGPRCEALDALLQKGVDAQARDREGQTALHYAATADARRCIVSLLRAGVPVDAADKKGRTALHLASSAGHVAIVTQLLVAGADPMARDNNMATPLHGARSRGVVDRLVDAGADILALDDAKHTPLHYAAWSGHAEAARRLLSLCRARKADPLILCDSGRTFLEEAAMFDKKEILEVAHQEGMSLNPPMDGNPPWLSPLHEATTRGMENAADYLLAHGADPHQLDMYGRSGLDWARLDADMLAIYAQHCDEKAQTDPKQAEGRIKATIVRTARKLLVQSESLEFYILGKCMIFLGDIPLARAAMGQTVENSCDMCGADSLYVCLTCEAIDLCEHCMTRYKEEGKSPGVCRGHDFLEITTADKEVLEEEGVRRQWLEGIIASHGS